MRTFFVLLLTHLNCIHLNNNQSFPLEITKSSMRYFLGDGVPEPSKPKLVLGLFASVFISPMGTRISPPIVMGDLKPPTGVGYSVTPNFLVFVFNVTKME